MRYVFYYICFYDCNLVFSYYIDVVVMKIVCQDNGIVKLK